MLGLLWFDQGKLAETDAMYTRTLQGYKATRMLLALNLSSYRFE